LTKCSTSKKSILKNWKKKVEIDDSAMIRIILDVEKLWITLFKEIWKLNLKYGYLID
jgi:hypothetical protein